MVWKFQKSYILNNCIVDEKKGVSVFGDHSVHRYIGDIIKSTVLEKWHVYIGVRGKMSVQYHPCKGRK